MSTIKRLAILPYTYGVGGPASFRQRKSFRPLTASWHALPDVSLWVGPARWLTA